MSGHSQFKNIMYRKGAQDSKRAKVFSKISREITVAVKEGGANAESNSRLRSALLSARSENMPKDNIERAIKKALGGGDDTDFQAVRYEGYGPGGVAIIVEGLTDNKKRAYKNDAATEDEMFEAAIECGAEDIQTGDDVYEITCAIEQLAAVRDGLSKKFGDPLEARITWKPKNTVPVDTDTANTLAKLVDLLEDNDDVQSVVTNAEVQE